MLKLDKQHRFQLNQAIRKISELQVPGKLFCVYIDSETLVFKQDPIYGVDKIIDEISVDQKGRMIFSKLLLELLDINENTTFLAWCEPKAVHVQKIEAK